MYYQYTLKFVLFYISMTLLLTSCIIQPTQWSSDTKLNDNEGIVIIGTHTDWQDKNSELALTISKSGSLSIDKDIVFNGENDLKIYVLTKGDYEISKIFVKEDGFLPYNTNSNAFLTFDKKVKFSVKPGKAIYLGDITLNIEIVHGPTISKFLIEDKFKKQVLIMNDKQILKSYKIEKQILQFPSSR